jgi:hypothetical protein
MSAASLTNLAWVFLRNEGDDTIEVSLAYANGFAYRRRLNLQTGRATYARADRMNASEVEWIAVDECSGQPLVGMVPS